MFIYQLEVGLGFVSITLRVEDKNQRDMLQYSGSSENIEIVESWLKIQTGVYGHIIGDATTPIDLDYVLKESSPWNYKQLQGEEIDNYNSGLSKDVVT